MYVSIGKCNYNGVYIWKLIVLWRFKTGLSMNKNRRWRPVWDNRTAFVKTNPAWDSRIANINTHQNCYKRIKGQQKGNRMRLKILQFTRTEHKKDYLSIVGLKTHNRRHYMGLHTLGVKSSTSTDQVTKWMVSQKWSAEVTLWYTINRIPCYRIPENKT